MALTDLRIPSFHQLKAVRGDWEGRYHICVNDQWHVRFLWTQRGVMGIEVTDYH